MNIFVNLFKIEISQTFLFLNDFRWRKGSCKLDRKCTLAHGEKELTAWNEHLKKMEMRMERKKEEETEKAEEKGEESMTSSTMNDDKRPATTYKVGKDSFNACVT